MVSLTPVSHILLDSQCDTILWHSATSWGCSDLLRHLGPIKSQSCLLALAGGAPWGTLSTTLPTVGSLHFPAITATFECTETQWALSFRLWA